MSNCGTESRTRGKGGNVDDGAGMHTLQPKGWCHFLMVGKFFDGAEAQTCFQENSHTNMLDTAQSTVAECKA